MGCSQNYGALLVVDDICSTAPTIQGYQNCPLTFRTTHMIQSLGFVLTAPGLASSVWEAKV